MPMSSSSSSSLKQERGSEVWTAEAGQGEELARDVEARDVVVGEQRRQRSGCGLGRSRCGRQAKG